MPRALKGMVLAAGLGTRLRPLTDLHPKPLVPFAGSTPLELALAGLKRAGIQEVAINSHYHPEQIASFVRANPLGQTLHLSYEAQLLGTGGCYPPLSDWLGGSDLLVLNGDVVADFDLAALIKRHRATNAAATMMLLPSVIAGESSVFHANGRILAIGKTPPKAAHQAGNFACAQILSPRLLELLPNSGVFDIVSMGYQKALACGFEVASCLHPGYWHDLRTPHFYWAAVLALLGDPTTARALGLRVLPDHHGVLLCDRQASYDNAHIGPNVVVESGVHIGAGAVVSQAVLWSGAVVPAGAVITSELVGPNLRCALTHI